MAKPMWQARWYDCIAWWLYRIIPHRFWRRFKGAEAWILPLAGRWIYRDAHPAWMYDKKEQSDG